MSTGPKGTSTTILLLSLYCYTLTQRPHHAETQRLSGTLGDSVSQCSPGWPAACSVEQHELELKSPACLYLLSAAGIQGVQPALNEMRSLNPSPAGPGSCREEEVGVMDDSKEALSSRYNSTDVTMNSDWVACTSSSQTGPSTESGKGA